MLPYNIYKAFKDMKTSDKPKQIVHYIQQKRCQQCQKTITFLDRITKNKYKKLIAQYGIKKLCQRGFLKERSCIALAYRYFKNKQDETPEQICQFAGHCQVNKPKQQEIQQTTTEQKDSE